MIHFMLLLSFLPLLQTQSCSTAKTCSQCITTHYICRWCKDAGFSTDRCSSKDKILIEKCNEWVEPNSTVNNINNNSSKVSPSSISLKLRTFEETIVPVTVKPLPNNKLDIYYLMDFSNSMSNDLISMKRNADQTMESLKSLSNDVAFGFGSFVDKPTRPYVISNDNLLHKTAPYSFTHHMDITTKLDEFKAIIEGLKISSNLDAPEGGLDAMIQACVCVDELKWRDGSYKVLILATDASFHIAGDGILGGVVKRNTGKCGMVGNQYMKSLDEDYPTLVQVNDVLIKSGVIIVFAVGSSSVSLYTKLSEFLTQLSAVGRLNHDSSNVASLIKQQISSLSKTIKLNPQGPLPVKVVPKCLPTQLKIENGCANVRLGEEAKFEVIFKIERCAEEAKKDLFKIEVPGFESIDVSLEGLCECECEATPLVQSEACLRKGNLTCGACQCQDSFFGEDCRCNISYTGETQRCSRIKNGMLCSGTSKGICSCGMCQCIHPSTEYYRYGEFCECSNYECPRNKDNEICSNNGLCDCGVCDCMRDRYGRVKGQDEVAFTGPDCSCTGDTSNCYINTTQCSNAGVCRCGLCECDVAHTGVLCDVCSRCGPLECSQYNECVLCIWRRVEIEDVVLYNEHNVSLWKECGCSAELRKIYQGSIDTSRLEDLHKACPHVPIDNDCSVVFYINYKHMGTLLQPILHQVLIEFQPDCMVQVNIMIIIISSIAGTLLIGISLLVSWRVYATASDRREFARFERDQAEAKWSGTASPLYKQPTTDFSNPIFVPAERARSKSVLSKKSLQKFKIK